MTDGKSTPKKKQRKPAPRVTVTPKIEVSVKGWYCDSRYATEGTKGDPGTFTGVVKNGAVSLTTGCGSHRATFLVADLAKLVEVAQSNPKITLD